MATAGAGTVGETTGADGVLSTMVALVTGTWVSGALSVTRSVKTHAWPSGAGGYAISSQGTNSWRAMTW